MYVRALIYLAAGDVTALFSSAPAFVFVLSLIFLKEPPLILRVSHKMVDEWNVLRIIDFFLQFVAVILAIAGIVLFAYEVSDSFKYQHSTSSLIGVALSIGSAIGAALYKVGLYNYIYMLIYKLPAKQHL